MERGRLTSDRGLDIAPRDWDDHFVEEQVPQSTALHSRLRDRRPYRVGPRPATRSDTRRSLRKLVRPPATPV